MPRFNVQERRLLLSMRGIGEVVVGRLEAAGFSSLQALREAGADRAVARVVAMEGQPASWLNRRRALVRALESAAPSLR